MYYFYRFFFNATHRNQCRFFSIFLLAPPQSEQIRTKERMVFLLQPILKRATERSRSSNVISCHCTESNEAQNRPKTKSSRIYQKYRILDITWNSWNYSRRHKILGMARWDYGSFHKNTYIEITQDMRWFSIHLSLHLSLFSADRLGECDASHFVFSWFCSSNSHLLSQISVMLRSQTVLKRQVEIEKEKHVMWMSESIIITL